jgi:hypothetical protein
MSDIIRFFDAEYGPKLGVRAPTFRAVVREAVAVDVQSIVETGCLRSEGNWAGDGQSTVIWKAYARFRQADFVTVDIDETALKVAEDLCPGLTWYCQDSVQYLKKRVPPIDLLYLDSLDVNQSDPQAAALHTLFELCAAMPKLHKDSIVFIDDTPMEDDGSVSGKGAYVHRYFKQLGILPFTSGYQIAWLMP